YRSSSFTTPFGGFKQSGIGREGGIESVKEFMEAKSVWMSSDLKMPAIFSGALSFVVGHISTLKTLNLRETT
ncbi:aldehyde dehydrogenase family protein, partial [Escherichia coli]|uniref:aldehyde dehydrogenase family protein n=1 Tax=Escherichia coli TaxID=562 RepID=UPI003C76EE65